MIVRSRLAHRISVVFLILGLFAPLGGPSAFADEASPATPASEPTAEPTVEIAPTTEPQPTVEPTVETQPTIETEPTVEDDSGNADPDLPDAVMLVPENPIETAATCTDGTLSTPGLTLPISEDIIYSVDPAAPHEAGQTVSIMAALVDPAASAWTEELPAGWAISEDGSVLTREFTFTGVECEPVAESSSIGINAVEDVEVTLTGPESVSNDDLLAYGIGIFNTGDEPAEGITLSLALPDTGSEWTLGTNAPAGCVFENLTLTCTGITVGPATDGSAGAVTFDIHSTVSTGAACGEHSTQATLGGEYEGTSSEIISTTIDCQDEDPDLSIELTGPVSLPAGARLQYVVTISNRTPERVQTGFTMQLPDTGNAWETNYGWPCEANDQNLLECDPVSVSPHDGTEPGFNQITIWSILAWDVACQDVSTTAHLTGDDDGASSDTVTTNIGCQGGVVTKTVGQETVEPGERISFTYTVENTGGDLPNWGFSSERLLRNGSAWQIDARSGALENCYISPLGQYEQVQCRPTSSPGYTFPAGTTGSITVSRLATTQDCGRSTSADTSTFFPHFIALNDDMVRIHGNVAQVTTVCNPDAGPDLSITKTGPDSAAPGDTLEYRITLTNSGSGDATEITVTDNLPDAGDVTVNTDTCEIGDGNVVTCADLTVPAQAGEVPGTLTIALTYAVPTDGSVCGDLVNTASFSLTAGEEEFTGESAVTTEIDCHTDLRMTFSMRGTRSVPGDVVEYWFDIWNEGNVDATGVNIVDDMPDSGVATLADDAPEACSVDEGNKLTCLNLTIPAQGEGLRIFFTYTIPTDGSVCGPLENTLTIEYMVDGEYQTLPWYHVRTVECDPALDLDLSASPDQVEAPGTVDISYTVSNTGNIDLTAVTFADIIDCDPDTDGIQSVINLIAAGTSATCESTLDVRQEHIDGGGLIVTGAIASGQDGQGNRIVSPMAETTIQITQTPGLTLTVVPETPLVDAPGTMDFTFTLANPGNVTLSDVTLDDGLPEIVRSFFAMQAETLTLGPGESTDITGTLQVTQADLDAGEPITTLATLTATAPDGTPLTESVETTVNIQVAGPALAIEKTASTPDDTDATEGTVITYSFTVTNIGDVTMANVLVNDDLPGLVWDASGGEIAAIAPGDVATVSATYTVTAADVTTGEVVNSATAIGDGPLCETDATQCGVTSAASEVTVAVEAPAPAPSPTAPPPTPTPSPTAPPATPAPTTPATPAPDAPPESTPDPAPGSGVVVSGLPSTGTGEQAPLAHAGWVIVLLATASAIVSLGWRLRSRS